MSRTLINPQTAPAVPDLDLIKRIGKGSYGEVWLAKDAIDVYRAVKVVYRDNFDDDRPYQREFSAIKKFEPISRAHHGQVNILHVGRHERDGYFFYVMELADDSSSSNVSDPGTYSPRTLKSELKSRGPLPAAECVRIGLALANALDHLHQSGLVHRDVKPSNIIFVKGVPKLADIGLVTHIDATRSFVGTEAYMPPEGAGTPRGDLYALGKVLYEISTGMTALDYPELPEPWREREDREALLELNEVIVKACAPDSKQQYASGRELAADLGLLERGQSVKRAHRIARYATGVRRVVAAVAIVTVLVAGWVLFRPSSSTASGLGLPSRQYRLTFNDGVGVPGVDYRPRPDRPGSRLQAESGGLLTRVAQPHAGVMYELFLAGKPAFLPFQRGTTLEVSVDVVRQDPGEVAVQFGVGGYIVGKTENAIAVVKESKPGRYDVPIMWEEKAIKRDNVRMVFQLTPNGRNADIRVQIIDLDTFPSAVLFSRTVIDTPGQDAVPNLPEYTKFRSIEFNPAPTIGQSVRVFLGVYNFTDKPGAEVLFDNLEARVWE